MQRPAKPLTPVRFRIQPPLNIMKIGIIGYGFVGKALAAGLNDDVNLIKIDPKLDTKIRDLENINPDAIFICVPTPMCSTSTQDISILRNVIDEIIKIDFQNLLVLKSTVLPNYVNEIKKLVPDVVYNPEFLREKHANDDFINSELIVFGGEKRSSDSLAEIYKNYTKCICNDYVFTDIKTASFIKYTINSFLATKVSFFNELKQLFDIAKADESWDNFIAIISKDKRIGSSHMNVPGHDGRLGYGGACLPKDSKAFSNYADNLGSPLTVLKSAISTNNKIRAEYNEQTDRELEQNITFEGDD